MFASVMDLCHPDQYQQPAKHLRKYRSRVILREDNVKDDKGYRAALTEQGAPASQVAAATFMKTVSRLPAKAGAAHDTVSARTHVRMSEALHNVKMTREGMPTGMTETLGDD